MEQVTCAVDGCVRPRRGRRTEWCNTHYFRVYRTGSPGPAEINVKGVFKACSVDGCSRQAKCLGVCDLHYQRLRTHGDVNHVTPPRRGADNPSWVGSSVGYGAAHDRVRRAKGSASMYACVECSRPATHWAYDHLDPAEVSQVVNGLSVTYSGDPDHYRPMCVPCHKRFDLRHLGRG